MRRLPWGLVAVMAAVVLMAATTGGRSAAHETIIVHQGDTLRTFFSIDSGSALDPGHQYTVAARCGVGHVFLRLLLNGQRLTNDTVLVNVIGCPQASADTVLRSLAIYSDEGGTLHPAPNDTGQFGDIFCLYAVGYNRAGQILTGKRFHWSVGDRTLLRLPTTGCPDTTVDPARLTALGPLPPVYRGAQ